MPRIVRAFPIKPGKLPDLQGFARECLVRAAAIDVFYEKYGVRFESWHVQQTPQGHLVICVTECEDPINAGAAYGASRNEFDNWFKSRVAELSGVDPNSDPLGPPTVELFRFDATATRHVELPGFLDLTPAA